MKDNEAENSLVVHHKAYDGESIVDLYRDISEMLDERMNPVAGKIPTDEHGFSEGIFTVSVVWSKS